jgi:hypothetical protein
VSNIILKPLPSGLFRVTIDGGASIPSAVEMLQFTGNSATTLEVTNASPEAAGDRLLGDWNTRVSTAPVPIFQPMPTQ